MKAFDYVGKDNTIVCFLYILMRDHITPGQVEAIMENHVEKIANQNSVKFSNEHLARNAIDVALRIAELATK